MKRFLSWIPLVHLMLHGTIGQADPLPKPTVAYSGNSKLTTPSMEVDQSIWRDGEFQRAELAIGGLEQVIITRPDESAIYMYSPSLGVGQKLPFDPNSDVTINLYSEDAELKAEVQEEVNGIPATRHAFSVVPDGSLFPIEGKVWVSSENIIVRYLQGGDGSADRITFEMLTLEVAPIDPEMFVVPSGVTIN